MATIDFDFQPRPWQEECINLQTQFTVLALHRRAGKTTLAIAELILYALQTKGIYAYICPFLNQADRNAWKPLKEMVSQFGSARVGQGSKQVATIFESRKVIEFSNGSTIMLLGADDPDNLRGIKFAGAVLDEVAQMPREAWSEVVMPALADSNGWALFIGTPKGENLFSELYRQGQNPAYHPEWSSRSYTVYDTGVFDKSKIEQFKRDMTEDAFKREYLCDFSASSTDQLIAAGYVEEACKRSYPDGTFRGFKRIAGLDVARFGDDASVIFIRQGKTAYFPYIYRGLSLVELAEKAAAICRKDQIDVVYCDGTGVGGGVVDILRDWGIPAYDVAFGQRPQTAGYANKRAEMWGRMADWIKKGGAIPDMEQLRKDLTAPLYETDENGVIKLERKSAIRNRLGFSPDLGDALALTFVGYENETLELENYEEIVGAFGTEKKAVTPNERYEQQIRGHHRSPRSLVQRGMGRSWRRAI